MILGEYNFNNLRRRENNILNGCHFVWKKDRCVTLPVIRVYDSLFCQTLIEVVTRKETGLGKDVDILRTK